MKGKIKAVGMAIIAVFAMSAVAASGASAETLFTADKYPVLGKGETEGEVNTFTLDETQVECSDLTGEGTIEEDTPELTLATVFGECSTSGTSIKGHQNGCEFLFSAGEHVAEDTYAGSAEMVCPEGKEIIFTLPESGSLCAVHLPPQGPLGGVTYTNVTGQPSEVTVDAQIEGIVGVTTQESIFCPLSGGEFDDAILEGQVIVRGYEDLGEGKAGSQIGVHVGTVE